NGNGQADSCEPQQKPDNRGCYKASDTVAPPDGSQPAYSFVDISTTGTGLSLSDDQVSSALPIGFSFNFYGTAYTSAFVSSNGFLTFLSGQPNGCCGGGPLPGAGLPNATIAALWTDLYPPNGAIYYKTLGSAPSRRFVVQFQGVPQCCGTSQRTTWEIILH